MKICFLIPDGIGIRNYLYSDILELLIQQGHEIVIWHALDPEVITLTTSGNGLTINQREFTYFLDPPLIQVLRESSAFARLKHNSKLTGNSSIMMNWPDKKGSWKRRMSLTLSELIGKRLKGYSAIVGIEKICSSQLRKSSAYRSYKSELLKIKPDVLFCTHQRFFGAAYAMIAAEDLGIKTATAIFSWDNLPKARLAFKPNYYLVWSDFMKRELEYFYPEIEKENIFVTGTPQFDFYRKENLIQSRKSFAERFGLDPSKRWILFSGDDAKTSPHDHLYLRDIAESLKKEDNIQIIFRQVPVEDTSRYQQVLSQYPQIVHINPFWKKGGYWQAFFPFPEDIAHLVNLAFHCDTVINIGSTMAMDFAFFDKPALYLRYDHQPDQTWSVKDIYRFQHFRSMEGLDPVGWIKSPQEIHSMILKAIHSPSEIGRDRGKWLDLIVQPHSSLSSAEQVASVLQGLALSQQKVY